MQLASRNERHRLGDQAGTRAIVEVLLGSRRLPADAVAAAMTWATASSVTDPDALLVEARRSTGRRDPAALPIGSLARFDRPTPDLLDYDELLAATR